MWSFALEAEGARRSKPASSGLSVPRANDASRRPQISGAGAAGSSVLRLQVLLDRARFSPGEIDGRYGNNTRRAVLAFNTARGLPGKDRVDAKTWAELNRDEAPAVVRYEISAEDVAGPFEKIPVETADKAKLKALGFESPLEGLAEKFHASPKLLRELNRGSRFDTAGAAIMVPSVARPAAEKVQGATVKVSESDRSVIVLAGSGDVVARYPATVGSEHDPLPVGTWKVNGVSFKPSFTYNPDLFWDSEPGDTKAKLAPGPNNPVGDVWVDLSKPHYGIHGSPEPATIGGATSHGCIRLTNWDAVELARLVAPGTSALLEK